MGCLRVFTRPPGQSLAASESTHLYQFRQFASNLELLPSRPSSSPYKLRWRPEEHYAANNRTLLRLRHPDVHMHLGTKAPPLKSRQLPACRLRVWFCTLATAMQKQAFERGGSQDPLARLNLQCGGYCPYNVGLKPFLVDTMPFDSGQCTGTTVSVHGGHMVHQARYCHAKVLNMTTSQGSADTLNTRACTVYCILGAPTTRCIWKSRSGRTKTLAYLPVLQ